MLVAIKAFGATCLAGAVAAGGLVTGDRLSAGDSSRDTAPAESPAGSETEVGAVEVSTTTSTEPPTTTTEPPTTTTVAPAVAPAVVAAGEAGTVQIVFNGPLLVVNHVDLHIGWKADVERREGGDVAVVFSRDRLRIRFTALMDGGRLATRLHRELVSFDGVRRFGDGDRPGDGDRWDGDRWDGDRWDGDHRWDGRR